LQLQQTVDIDSQIFGEGASGNGFEEDQSTSQRNQLMFEYMQEVSPPVHYLSNPVFGRYSLPRFLMPT